MDLATILPGDYCRVVLPGSFKTPGNSSKTEQEQKKNSRIGPFQG